MTFSEEEAHVTPCVWVSLLLLDLLPPIFFLCDIFQDHTQTVLPSGLSDVFPSGLSDVLHCGLSDVSSGLNSGWLLGHEATCPVSCAGLTVGSVGRHDDLFWVTLTDHLVRGGVYPS